MNVYELCQRHVVTVRRHEDLTTAAWMMRERNVGCLVVVEPAGAIGGARPIGMLTDRDIVTNVIARGSDPRNLIVDDVMTRHPITVWAMRASTMRCCACATAACAAYPWSTTAAGSPESSRWTTFSSIQSPLPRADAASPRIRPDIQPGRIGIDRI